jgi:hypothetical protein
LLLLAYVLAGCGSASHFEYDGNWVGNRNLDRPDLNEVMRYTAGRVTLNIHGQRFELTQAGVPTGGEVVYAGDHLELNTKTYFGQGLEKAGKDAEKMHPTITVTPQTDGSLLFDDPMAIDGKPIKLTREK